MTREGLEQLQIWYKQNYPATFPETGARRTAEWVKQLDEVYDGYSDYQIKTACKKWLNSKKSKYPPFDRELKELAGDPEVPVIVPNPNAPMPGQIFMDSDGYKYEWAMDKQNDPNSFTWIVCQRPGKPYRLEVDYPVPKRSLNESRSEGAPVRGYSEADVDF